MRLIKNIISCLLALPVMWSCSGFLDERPNKGILIPTSIEDIRALLDNDAELNQYPVYGLLSSDDMMLTDAGWSALASIGEQNAYIWNEDIFGGGTSADWAFGYRAIFIANVVLDQLEKLPVTPESERLRGEALFHRAHAHFMLAQLFGEPYRLGNPGLAIPLRLDTEILKLTDRSGNEEFYNRIIEDLNASFELLAMNDPIKTRPTKLAAKALLGRVYLTMSDYSNAEAAVDWVMARPEVSLMNYNSLNASAAYPSPKYNSEVILHGTLVSIGSLTSGNVNSWILPELLDSYEPGDLRRTLFGLSRPNGGTSFRGQYTGNFSLFGGLALDEVYLIKAECLARRNADAETLNLMNTLLETRFEDGMYTDFEGLSGQELLGFVLEEKRKSLLFRGVNWIDLRRLNQDDRFARTIRRTVNGTDYELNPNSKKYVLPIPQAELSINPITQNDRND